MMNSGTAIRDDYESHVRCEQGLCSSQSNKEGAYARSRPGVLIFSCERKLLHMNSRALALIGQPNQAEIRLDHYIRSTQVNELSARIQETLDYRRKADIWEIFQLNRAIFEVERKILVRGFGLANRNCYGDSHIVVVVEEVGPRRDHEAEQALPPKHQQADF